MRKLFSIFAVLALVATVSYAQQPVSSESDIIDGDGIELTDDLSSDETFGDSDITETTETSTEEDTPSVWQARPRRIPTPAPQPEPIIEPEPVIEEPAAEEVVTETEPIMVPEPELEAEEVTVVEPEKVVEDVVEVASEEEEEEEVVEEIVEGVVNEAVPVKEPEMVEEAVEEVKEPTVPLAEELTIDKMKGFHPFKKNKCLSDKEAHFSIAFEGGIAMLDGDFIQPNVTIMPWTRVLQQGGVSLTYDFTPVWSLSAAYNFAFYGVKKQEQDDQPQAWLVNGRMHTSELMVNFDVVDAWVPHRQSNICSFYLMGGVGFGIYNSVYDDGMNITTPRKDGRHAITGLFSLGAALEFNLGRLTSLGVKGLYHFYMTDNLDTRIEGPNNDCMEYASAYLRFKVGGVKRNHQRNFSSAAFLENELNEKNPARVQKQKAEKAAEKARIHQLVTLALDSTLKDSTFVLRADPLLMTDSTYLAAIAAQTDKTYTATHHGNVQETRQVAYAEEDGIDIESLDKRSAKDQHEVVVVSDEQIAKVVRENMEVIRLKTQAQNYFVYFKNNSTHLTDQGLQAIQQAADLASNTPELCYALIGYCDNTGTERTNKRLAQRRADRVMKELIEVYHIAPDRLFSLGKGRLDNVSTSYGPNRRVELILCTKAELAALRKASETPEDIMILTTPTEEESVSDASVSEEEREVEETIMEETIVEEATTVEEPQPISSALAADVLAEREVLITVTSTSITSFARLARKYYKNVSCWPYVFAANRDIVINGSPDLLPRGVQVSVPQLTQEEINAATPETEAEMAAIVSQAIK